MDKMKNKSNENSKKEFFALRLNQLDDFETIKKIRDYKELGYDSQSDLLRDAVISFLDGNSPTSKLDEEIKREKLKALQNKNALHEDLKSIRNSQARIQKYHADHLDVIGDNPSSKAKEAMTHYVNGTRPYDENAIHCPDCKFSTNSNESISRQINVLTEHMQTFHRRSFTEKEANTISELLT